MAGGDGVMVSDSDESGFSTKETTLYMWQMETFAWSLRGMQCSLYFLFSSLCFISQSTFSTTRFDQHFAAARHGRGPPSAV